MFSSSLSKSNQKSLTDYPPGSLRELWTISFPLMISLMSASLMLFLDRILLARFSLDALNASANAALFIQLMQFWCLTTVSIAEVFVGRYNGANRYSKLAQPVWQMIWLSAGTIFLFIPLGLFAGPYLFTHEAYAQLEIAYFKWLMCFGPFAILSAALSAFYIGQGKLKFVTCMMILANLINVILDVILIFGIHPYIPSMGVTGAALSTGIAQTIQATVLFIAFLRPKNQRKYGTNRWKFQKNMFLRCIRTGLPNAIAHTLEILAWVVLFHLMTQLGTDYITVVAVAQSILFLFTFLTDALSKGASTIASNLIGSEDYDVVWKVLKSGVLFYALVFILLGVVLVWYPDPLIECFISQSENGVSLTARLALHSACFWVWFFFFFDGINWLLVGLLTASGDTRFIMAVGGLGPWMLALGPVYIVVVHFRAPADITWLLMAIYAFIMCVIYLWRFKSEKWKAIALSECEKLA